MAAEQHHLPLVSPEPTIQLTVAEHHDRLVAERGHPPVAISITLVCPCGLGPCWGGANDGLTRMSDIEITLLGEITKKGEQLILAGTSTRKQLPLAPFKQESQIGWDVKTKAPGQVTDAETGLYKRLEATLTRHS